MTRLVPIDELDAELEGALRLAQEIVLVEAQHVVVQRDGRDGRLADPDDADLVRLHQRDGETRPHARGKRSGRHPPGSATAGDDDSFDLLRGHGFPSGRDGCTMHSPARAPASVRGIRAQVWLELVADGAAVKGSVSLILDDIKWRIAHPVKREPLVGQVTAGEVHAQAVEPTFGEAIP